MKNFFPLIIILIIASSLCTSTEEKTKNDESTYIFNSLINGASNFYSNYLESTVKFVSCPLGSKGCEIAVNIQIASEGLKTAGIGQEAGAKIIEKVIDKTSTETVKEVAGKGAEKVVYKWGTKTSFSFFKIIPAISSGFSFYNAYKKFKDGDNLGGSLYVAEGIVGWIPGLSYVSLIPSVADTIKEVSEIKSNK